MRTAYLTAMPDPREHRFVMRVDAAFLALVDEWRRKQADIPSRSEAVRRLVQLAVSKPPA